MVNVLTFSFKCYHAHILYLFICSNIFWIVFSSSLSLSSFYGWKSNTEKRVNSSGNTFWSHICRKTFGKTTSLTLIPSWYIDYTFSTLFTCVLQISAEIESNWDISFNLLLQMYSVLCLCWDNKFLKTNRRMLRLKNPRHPSHDGTP